MTTQAKTYDTKFNAHRGAQRTRLKPGEFEVFKTPDGRFGWRRLAAEPAQALAPVEVVPPKDAYEPPAFLRRTETVEAAIDPEPVSSIPVTELTADSHPIAATNAAPWPAGEGENACPAHGPVSSPTSACYMGTELLSSPTFGWTPYHWRDHGGTWLRSQPDGGRDACLA